MSLVLQKTATASDNTLSVRLTKAVAHIELRRFGTLSVLTAGLLAGLPETVSAEITHPTRERARPADRIQLGHIALYGQHGRGPIVEILPATTVQNPDGSVAVNADGTQMYALSVKYYLNDNGPIEVLADDHFTVTIEGLVAGAQYELHAPEMPVLPQYANSYNKFEQGIILENDRERMIQTAGKTAIMIPNTPAAIERILLTFNINGVKTQQEFSLYELLQAQADKNPVITVLSVTGTAAQRRTLQQMSASADLFLLDLGVISAIQIDTVLGQRLVYTVVSVATR